MVMVGRVSFSFSTHGKVIHLRWNIHNLCFGSIVVPSMVSTQQSFNIQLHLSSLYCCSLKNKHIIILLAGMPSRVLIGKFSQYKHRVEMKTKVAHGVQKLTRLNFRRKEVNNCTKRRLETPMGRFGLSRITWLTWRPMLGVQLV